MSRMKSRYVHDYGGKGELILLLHGFLGSTRDWSKLAPKLVHEGYRVIALDLLGFGQAPKPSIANYDYRGHVLHINNALKELSANEPFILMGHSMGALLAKRYALEYGQKVSRLVLLHPPLYRDSMQARDTLRGSGALYRFLLDSRYRNLVWPIIRIVSAGRMRHTKWSRERSLKNIIEKAEGLKDLKILKKETLLFVGLYDRPEYIKNLEQCTVGFTIKITLQDVRHMSLRQQPRLVEKAVVAFLTN